MRRTSYQQGSLKLADRKKEKVWEFRWREVQLDGTTSRKNIVIGTFEEFPTASAAQSAVDALRLTINRQTPQQLLKSVSFETLVKHYREHELPDIFHHRKPAPEPLRTAAELDAFTGLRRGELIGLQWRDVDFDDLVVHVRRSVVMMVQGAPKTEASAKDVPLDAALAESLLKLRLAGPYNRPTDWVFASATMKGEQPLWPETLWRRYGKPAVKRAGITKRVCFHTFRHTYTTLLTQNNEDVKVVQELLRHANSRITLDLYAQAGMPEKREAQSKIVQLVLRKGKALA